MLAIIPARGGSKGVPKKNIKLLCGKPLIVYTIEAAMAADTIDRIIVSTDDPEIAQVARQYDVEIPFMRPKELAQDDSLAIDSYIYTIDRLNKECNNTYKEFVVLQPTSPLRTAQDIDKSVKLFYQKNADSVVSCVKLPYPREWICSMTDDGALKGDKDSDLTMVKNRQEFKPCYITDGAIYVFSYSLLKEKRVYYSDKTYAYVMSSDRSMDIDTELDFNIAELLIRQESPIA